jgi:phosphate starvation-inducible protein PhoH and related proteins
LNTNSGILEFNGLDEQAYMAFCGPNDSNLKILSKCCGKNISFRNEKLMISDCDEVTKMNIAKIAAKLLTRAQNGKTITEQDVIYNYRMVTRNEDFDMNDMNEHVVGRTLAGKVIIPKTKGQLEFVKALQKNPIVFAIGPAGTGKTYLAVIQAVTALKKGEVKRIVLTRPAVEAGENLGFLPGDLKEKVDPYLTPLYDALHVMLGNEKTEVLIEKGTVEIAPLAYMRGRTLDDCYVILDEAQNTTTSQMKMFLTRLGFNSKMIITGDITQIDLDHKTKSGLEDASEILRDIDEISIVHLSSDDVVRHPLVQKIIERYEHK